MFCIFPPPFKERVCLSVSVCVHVRVFVCRLTYFSATNSLSYLHQILHTHTHGHTRVLKTQHSTFLPPAQPSTSLLDCLVSRWEKEKGQTFSLGLFAVPSYSSLNVLCHSRLTSLG